MTKIRLALPLIMAGAVFSAACAGSSAAHADGYFGRRPVLPQATYSFSYRYGPHYYKYRYSFPVGRHDRYRHGDYAYGYPRGQRYYRGGGFRHGYWSHDPRFWRSHFDRQCFQGHRHGGYRFRRR